MKLTKTQMELLQDAAADENGVKCVKAYMPSEALVRLGLAKWTQDDEHGGRLVPTDAGRQVLERAEI